MQTVTPGTWVMMAISVMPAIAADSFQPQIPKTWDDSEMGSVEIPLSHPDYSPKHTSADFYYRMPVRAIYEYLRSIPHAEPGE